MDESRLSSRLKLQQEDFYLSMTEVVLLITTFFTP